MLLTRLYKNHYDSNAIHWELLVQCIEFSYCTAVLIVVWGLEKIVTLRDKIEERFSDNYIKGASICRDVC
jgi:Pyruvate/2-oxoacid:ferredoxin oxidoreductase delta subunit